MAQLKVTLVKSLIGSKKDQIATAQALGLRKMATAPCSPTMPRPKARWPR